MTLIKINIKQGIKIDMCPSLVIPARGIWVLWLTLKLDESSMDFFISFSDFGTNPNTPHGSAGLQNCGNSYSKFFAHFSRVSFLSAWLLLDDQSFSYQILLSVTSAWKMQIPGSLIPYSICLVMLKDMDIPGHLRHQRCLWEDKSMSDTIQLPAEL